VKRSPLPPRVAAAPPRSPAMSKARDHAHPHHAAALLPLLVLTVVWGLQLAGC